MKISIVTPSLNQGAFIERTIKSVLSQQGGFQLEYVIIDGGSTDNTLSVVRQYADRLTWISEPDEGQSQALNKGFHMITGDVCAWLNADDTYMPGTLARIADEFERQPFAWCFGKCRIIDERDRETRRIITGYKTWCSRSYSYRRLLRINFISQPAVFISREAFVATGDISMDLTYSMDYDYWLRLGKKYTPRYVDCFLANFRWHSGSITGARFDESARQAYAVARSHAPRHAAADIVLHWVGWKVQNVLYRIMEAGL